MSGNGEGSITDSGNEMISETEGSEPEGSASADGEESSSKISEEDPVRRSSSDLARFMNGVLPGYNSPGKKVVEDRIEKTYIKAKDKVRSTLNAASSVAITIEAWSASSAKSYITVAARTLDANWRPVSFTLETIEIKDRHKAVNLNTYLKKMVVRWNLQNKIVGVVHNNANNVTVAVRGSKSIKVSVPCFAHTLQCAVDSGLAEENVRKLIQKARNTVRYFEHSTTAAVALTNQQYRLNLPRRRLILSCRSRCNSTYVMLEKLLEQRLAILAVLDRNCKLKNADWEAIRELAKLLKPFYWAMKMTSAENGLTLSMTRPLIRSLLTNFFKLSSTDGELASDFKVVVGGKLQKHLLMVTGKDRRGCTAHVAQLAMIFDPRYRSILGENEDDKISIAAVLTHKVNDNCDASSESKITKAEVFDFLFTGEDASKFTEINTSHQWGEIDRYLSEADTDRHSDPLRWWRDNEARYPLLAQMARKYLAVPATSVPAERVFSTGENILEGKWSCLSPKRVDTSIFLYHNEDLI